METLITIKVEIRGSTKNTEQFLQRMLRREQFTALERFGPKGVAALSSATPKESSLTADSWYYEIRKQSGLYSITWLNHHVEDGVSIAILLQYGHGTKNGGYVQGRDFINPDRKSVV